MLYAKHPVKWLPPPLDLAADDDDDDEEEEEEGQKDAKIKETKPLKKRK